MGLSIIIPVYNSERVINTCLESLLCTNNDIECIVVNDGSKDNTEKIVLKYLEHDNRIKLINIENHGVSYARNIGIEYATKEYVTFIDSDDFFYENSLDSIIKKLNSGTDFYIFSYLLNNKGKNKVITYGNKTITKIECIRKHIIERMDLNTCWAKVYKLDIIKNNNISFPTNLKIGEDSVFVMRYLDFVDEVSFFDDIVLVYNNVIGNTMNNLKIEWFNDYLSELLIRESLATKYNLDSNQIYLLYMELYFRYIINYSKNNKIINISNIMKSFEIKNFKQYIIDKYKINKNFKCLLYFYLFKNENIFIVILYKFVSLL